MMGLLGLSSSMSLICWMLTLYISYTNQENVALSSAGATCLANPTYNNDYVNNKQCTGAIDGVVSSSARYRWAFVGNPINSWIEVKFDKLYTIASAEIVPLFNVDERTFKLVAFLFSTHDNEFQQSGTSVPYTFSNMATGLVTETANFNPTRQARTIRMKIATSYKTIDLDKVYNGLTELKYNEGTASPTPAPTTTTTTTTTTPATVPVQQEPEETDAAPTTSSPPTPTQAISDVTHKSLEETEAVPSSAYMMYVLLGVASLGSLVIACVILCLKCGKISKPGQCRSDSGVTVASGGSSIPLDHVYESNAASVNERPTNIYSTTPGLGLHS